VIVGSAMDSAGHTDSSVVVPEHDAGEQTTTEAPPRLKQSSLPSAWMYPVCTCGVECTEGAHPPARATSYCVKNVMCLCVGSA
jgi:hypothetical protein